MIQSWPCPLLNGQWIPAGQCEALTCSFKCEVRDLMKPLYGKEDVDVDMADLQDALIHTKCRIEFESNLARGNVPVVYTEIDPAKKTDYNY